MAIYLCRCGIVSRRIKDRQGKTVQGKQRSVVAKAAYRAGETLYDARKGHTYSYSNREAEVAHSEILAPESAPARLGDRQELWNAVERRETRSDSQLAKEWLLALPRELDEQQQIDLVREWCSEKFVDNGFICDVAIHRGGGKNPHCHVLQVTRPVDLEAEECLGKKPDLSSQFNGRGFAGLGAKAELVAMRESWAIACNEALEAAGHEERISHLSLAARGIDRQPEATIGINALALQRKGIIDDPERVKMVRQSRLENYFAGMIRSVRETGEVQQDGVGTDMTQRISLAWDWTKEKAAVASDRFMDLLRDESSGGRGWQDYVAQRRELDVSREPGMEPEL